MSLQELFHAFNNGERLEDTYGNDLNTNNSNSNIRDRDDNANNINKQSEGSHLHPSIIPLDTSSRKERTP